MPKRNTGWSLEWRSERKVFEAVRYVQGKRQRKSSGTSCGETAEEWFSQFLLEQGKTEGPSDPSERAISDILADYAYERGQYVKGQQTLGGAIAELDCFWNGKPASAVKETTCRNYVAHRNKLYRARQEERLRNKLAKVIESNKRRQNRGREPLPLPFSFDEIDGMLKDISAGMVRRELGVLAAAINHDFKQGRLINPVHVWKPQENAYKDRWLTRKEAAALLRASRLGTSRDYLPLFILIGLYTGARKGAILELRWGMIDFENNIIDFNPPGRERTKKGRPKVPIAPRLRRFLEYARRRGTDTGFVIHRDQMPIKNVRKSFKNAAVIAGMNDVTPHVLRHTCATWLTQKGISFAKIARYLGHSNSRTTEEIYAHHSPDYLREAAESIGQK